MQLQAKVRSKQSDRRRAVVFLTSAIGHLGVLLILFGGERGGVITGGARGGATEGQVVNVMLVEPSMISSPRSTSSSASTALNMKLRVADQGIALAKTDTSMQGALQRLADRLTVQSAETASGNQIRTSASSTAADKPAAPQMNSAGAGAAGSTKGEGASENPASAGDFFGTIAPCWRNLSFRGQVPVSIEVVVGGRGGSRPPRVLRESSAILNEVRLRSEANALAAVAACLPRGTSLEAERVVRVDFPASL